MIYIKDMDMPVDCMACRIACDKENYGVIGRPPKCPLAEAPGKGVLEQFRWERDVAMAQLEEYGIPFGTDKDEDMVRVVRCKDCRFWKNEHLCLVMSRYGSIDTKAEHYCSYGERSK